MAVPGVMNSSGTAPFRRLLGTMLSGQAFQWPIPSGKACRPPWVASAGTGTPPVSSSPTIEAISEPAPSALMMGA